LKITTLDGFPIPDSGFRYVGEPFEAPDEDVSQPNLMFWAAPLECEPYFFDWGSLGAFSIYGAEIIPSSEYQLQRADETCADLSDEACWSAPITLTTGVFGDVCRYFANEPGAPPQPDFNDVACMVSKFLATPGAPPKRQVQIQPNVVFPIRGIDFRDISMDVQSLIGQPYWSLLYGPCTCPSAVTCGATPCTSDFQCQDVAGGLCVDGFCTDACARCTP